MRAFAAALVIAPCLYAATAKMTFTRSFPGSVPDYICVEVDRTGTLEYKESPKDDRPVKTQLQGGETAALFSLAEKLDYFKAPLESGLKVANTGKKTFRYEDENGGSTEVSFNYSTNETAKQLLDKFEQIAASERAYVELEGAVHYDKLGVNDALADVESLWLRKQLAAPLQFVPLLTRITTHESFMHLVRERAARLRDEFQGATPAAGEEKQ